MSRSKQISLWSDERGASTVEFVLVLPGMVLLTIGTIYLCFMMYAASTLHFAVEDAARCASVKLATCTSIATTQTYAASRYRGPNLTTPLFVATSQACGSQVVGTGTYSLRTGLATISVPLSAKACFP